MFDGQIERIKEKFNRLKNGDKNFRLFGSVRHRHELNDVLSEEEVAAFEARYKIRLPDEYRAFLLAIGNGGAGPFYGLEKLEDSLYADMDARKDETQERVDPSLPFPHTEPQIMFPEGYNLDESDDEDFYKQWDDPKHTQGILRLCNFGCGVYLDLVVNGEEYGNIWSSDLASDNGIYPWGQLGDEAERITFLDWYELWLDQSLKELRIKK